MRFSQISLDTFKEFQLEAGMILKTFNPEDPDVKDADIVCATTGGIKADCVPTYRDNGADVDNCPPNMMELMQITSWNSTLGFTALNMTPEVIRISLGAADIHADSGKIVPRVSLKNTDFSDIWWVGDRSDGGLVAVRLINALSTSGFALTTTKDGKGNVAVSLRGHVSINAQDVVPMEFYVQEGEPE